MPGIRFDLPLLLVEDIMLVPVEVVQDLVVIWEPETLWLK